jgi:hypothetical protein
MNTTRRFFLGMAAAVSLFAMTTLAQDSQSLGDLARQQRQQKEQSTSAEAKAAKASKVITNEQIPEHASYFPETRDESGPSPFPSNGMKQPPEHLKAQIQAQKSQIASLQRQLDQISESIRFAPVANCVGRCVQWNERQREKQHQADRMQTQLQEEKKRLEEMQESARKQGFGSSVYDP